MARTVATDSGSELWKHEPWELFTGEYMSNELTVKEEEQNALALAEQGGWGAIEELESTDLLIPKIYHQQATSKFAKEGTNNARPGDFCDSLTAEVLATKDQKLEVIIFGVFKTMVISKKDLMSKTDKWQLDKIVPVTKENAIQMAKMPFQEEIDGDKYKNNLTYNFYCLLPSKLKELPYVFSFASTKTKCAQKLNTMLQKLDQAKKPGASVVFEFTSKLEAKDTDTWFGLEVTQGRNATPEELMRAYAWHMKSKTQKFVAEEPAEEAHVVNGEEVPF